LARGLGLGLWLGLGLAAAGLPPEHPVDLNTATVTELMQLPRVGIRTAERIVVNSISICEFTVENANPQFGMRISIRNCE